MTQYTFPQVTERPTAAPQTAYLIASGDLRESANIAGWPTQLELEAGVTAVLADLGWSVVRAHDVDPQTGHGFISSQRMGLEVFKNIPTDAPLIVAEAVWQYSHHVLAGLRTHQGPILTVANFAGQWPGLVGLLGLNAGLTKMGQEYSTLWSVDFTDDWFRAGLKEWVDTGRITHDASHVRALPSLPDSPEVELGRALGDELLQGQGHHRRLRRRLHGHVQRHLRRRAAQPDRHLQGAAQPVGPVRRDAEGLGAGGRRRVRVAHRARHDLQLRAGSPRPS